MCIAGNSARFLAKRPVPGNGLALLLVLSIAPSGPAASEMRQGRFIEITAEAGLHFRHTSAVRGEYRLPEVMGSGAALFDYDHDGDLDIYLVNSEEGRSRLFGQTADGTFKDVTGPSGLDNPGYGMGAALGDFDNDGDLDIFVTNVGADRLYRNDGHGVFDEISDAAGIEGDTWSSSAAFCDVDADGYLDLYVVTYVATDPREVCTDPKGERDYCPPSSYRPAADQIFLNTGKGTFRNVGEKSGISRVAGRGLGVICMDFNGDHRSDVLVANDGEANHLWINGGDGTFEERGISFGVSTNLFGEPEASMGIALGDVDGDLDLDLFMTHIDRESNTLYTRARQDLLVDATIGAQLGHTSVPFTGFGTVFFDADHDGDLDLAIANGRVRKSSSRRETKRLDDFHSAYADPNLMLMNTGTGKFLNGCGEEPFCSADDVSRGLIAGDIDRDGDLDLLVTNSNGPARLYRNQIANEGTWLQIRAIDPALSRDAIGALVRVRIGDRWLVRPVVHTTGYLTSSDATVHFGLGDASDVDAVVVVWPDGEKERFPAMPANQRRLIHKGSGRNE